MSGQRIEGNKKNKKEKSKEGEENKKVVRRRNVLRLKEFV